MRIIGGSGEERSLEAKWRHARPVEVMRTVGDILGVTFEKKDMELSSSMSSRCRVRQSQVLPTAYGPVR